MKISKLIYLTTLFIPLQKAIVKDLFLVYTEETYGPFDVFCDDFDMEIYCMTSSPKLSHYAIIEYRDVQGNFLESNRINPRKIGYSPVKFILTIPSRDYLDEDGLFCTFLAYENNALKKTVEFEITPQEPFKVDPRKYKSYRACYGFKIEGNKQIYKFDDFTFESNYDYFVYDIYHRLRLDQMYFGFDSENNFQYEEAYMEFENLPETLSYLNKEKIYLSLEVLEDGNIGAYLKEALYVDKDSLKTYTKYSLGLIKTNSFYFPINRSNEFVDINVNFVFKNIGKAHVDIVYQTTYTSGGNYIGQCKDSMYCIAGGVH